MLNKKTNINWLLTILIMLILMVSIHPILILAKTNNILIHLEKTGGVNFIKEGISFDIWYITDKN